MKEVVKQPIYRLLLDLLRGLMSTKSLNSASSVSIQYRRHKLAELSRTVDPENAQSFYYLRETARSFCFIHVTVKSPEPDTMVSVKSSPQIIAELAVLGSEMARSSSSRDF